MWVTLVEGITSKSFLATGLTTGLTYSFKVQSRNIVGYSPASSAVAVVAATKPNTPAAPVTQITNNDVTIRWVAP